MAHPRCFLGAGLLHGLSGGLLFKTVIIAEQRRINSSAEASGPQELSANKKIAGDMSRAE